VSPDISYTTEQYAACEPRLIIDADSDARKSYHGKSITASAVAIIQASEGRFIDTRDGAIAYTKDGGTNVKWQGRPFVNGRYNGILPHEVRVTHKARRGTSLRSGRNAKAV